MIANDWGTIALKIEGADEQTIKNYRLITGGQLLDDYDACVEDTIQSTITPAMTTLNPVNMYNFFINPNTSLDEMVNYA